MCLILPWIALLVKTVSEGRTHERIHETACLCVLLRANQTNVPCFASFLSTSCRLHHNSYESPRDGSKSIGNTEEKGRAPEAGSTSLTAPTTQTQKRQRGDGFFSWLRGTDGQEIRPVSKYSPRWTMPRSLLPAARRELA